ncbi:MAG: hypothetical protein ACOYMG_15230, partial [Candidatus Methylumidiphilus sp.]
MSRQTAKCYHPPFDQAQAERKTLNLAALNPDPAVQPTDLHLEQPVVDIKESMLRVIYKILPVLVL